MPRRLDREPTRLYNRPTGVVCVEAPNVIPNWRSRAELAPFVEELRRADVDWLWESARSHPGGVLPEFVADKVPERRSPTLLTGRTQKHLILDLQEQDLHRYWRFVTIAAFDRAPGETAKRAAAFSSLIRRFAETEVGPVRFVLVQAGDTAWQYLYLPHPPIEAIRRLLERWNVSAERIDEVRPYQGGPRLESMYGPEAANARRIQ